LPFPAPWMPPGIVFDCRTANDPAIMSNGRT
jgi:hypothetical protein